MNGLTADTASDLLSNPLCLEPFIASNMNDLLALTLLNFLLKLLSVYFTVHFLFLFSELVQMEYPLVTILQLCAFLFPVSNWYDLLPSFTFFPYSPCCCPLSNRL